MAASLITRTGFRKALLKSNPTQPPPRCFGSRKIRPLRTGAGKADRYRVEFPAGHAICLIFRIITAGVIRGPESNFLCSCGDIISFT